MLRSQSNAAARPMVPYLRMPTSEEEVPYWTTEPAGAGTSENEGMTQNIGRITGRQTPPASGAWGIPVIGEDEELLSNMSSGWSSEAKTSGIAGESGYPNGGGTSAVPIEPGNTTELNRNQNMGMGQDYSMAEMIPNGQKFGEVMPTNPPKSTFTPSADPYIGTMRGLLARNLGQYVVATFLMGPQNVMTWEGFLHSVGEDYLVLYQPSRRRYASAELSGLQFIEFYEPNNAIPGFGETYR